MKLVINRCFGGYSLSPRAVARMAELNGRKCFLFRDEYEGGKHRYVPVTLDQLGEKRTIFFSAFDVPDPESLTQHDANKWHEMSMEDRHASNALYETHSLSVRPEPRTDPILLQVVEELGKAASGSCADLAIIEIPDGIEYEIEEYDGNESVHEVHRSWS